MSDQWFWAKDKQRCGPCTYDQLRQMALSALLSPDDMVFNEGGSQWAPARHVPGLDFPVPAPVALPASEPEKGPGRLEEWKRLCAVAYWQRRLNLSALAGLVLMGGAGMVLPQMAVVIVPVAALIFAVLWVVLIVQLSRALGFNPWAQGLLGLVPVVNLIILLKLSQRANVVLRAAGAKIGFLGVDLPEDAPTWFVQKKPKDQGQPSSPPA